MPSAIPRADESVGWPNLDCCPHKHRASVPCPPSATWLVLHFCPDCDETRQLYCRKHRDRHMPSGDAHHTLPPAPAEADHGQLAAGEGGKG